MKTLTIIGLVLGVIALGIGLYCQFYVVPSVEAAERLSRSYAIWDPKFTETRRMFIQRSDLKTTCGTIAIVMGGLGLLGGIFAGIKKAKLGFAAATISLPGLILGLLQATHLFS